VTTRRSRKSSSSEHRFNLRLLLYELANTQDSAIDRFRAKYPALYHRERYSDDRLLDLRDELRLLWEFDAQPGQQLDLERCRTYVPDHNSLRGIRHADTLQRLLSQFTEATVQEAICNAWLRMEKQPVAVVWTKQKKVIAPVRQCLPAVLALACVQYSGRLKVCANKHCPVPYFISKRKDQKYCSDECAAPAKREAKRRWWSMNRAKNAQQNLKLSSKSETARERGETK
jgi:hypothetical protein